jgi:OOP family OmpA-OmpF porin
MSQAIKGRLINHFSLLLPMWQRPFVFILLTGLLASCMSGSYPSGSPSGGGQSTPDDTYPSTGSTYPNSQRQYPDSRRQSPNSGSQYPNSRSQYPNSGSQYPNSQRQYPNTNNSYPGAGNQTGSGRSADPGTTVNNIRLTQEYTILDLTYIDRSQPRKDQNGRPVSTNTIGFDPNAYLVSANGARTFVFVKVEGIPVKREQVDRNTGKTVLVGMNTFPGDRVDFSLYFQRLDKGLENFDLFECISDQYTCWNIYNLHVNNPADDVVYSPPATPKPVPNLPRKSTSQLPPAPIGNSGGEMEVPKPTAPAPIPVATIVTVSGVVSDAKNKRPVTATIDYQLSASKQIIDSVQSFASTGVYRMSLNKGQVYTYVVSARGYQSTSGVLDLSKTAGGQRLTRDIAMTPLAVGDKVTLKNIYFEMSKSDLLSASFAELDKLVGMMQDNPNMTIRLEGHTDIIGDHSKNLQLSQDRVIACQRYLVQKGINIDRIQTIGYGDTRPILTKGTDEDRKINRRVEFAILTL